MSYPRFGDRFRLVVSRLRLGVLTFGLLVLGPTVMRAADPVHELREVLQADPVVSSDPKELDKQLEYRKAQIEKHIGDLKSLTDLARGLALHDWRIDNLEPLVRQLDRNLWEKLADRFTKAVEGILQSNDADRQRAVANLIGTMAQEARVLPTKKNIPLRVRLSQLGAYLEALLERKGTDPDTASAAAWALGKVNPNPESAVQALGTILVRPNIEERRAAALALVDLIGMFRNERRSRSDFPEEHLPGQKDSLEAQVLHVAGAIVPKAVLGLKDADAKVRQTCIDAIDQAAAAAADQIRTKPDIDFPPAGRALTEAEKKRVRDYYREIEDRRGAEVPLAKALALAVGGEGKAGLVQIALTDRDPLLREQSWLTLEDIAYTRRLMVIREETLPPLPMAEAREVYAPRKRGSRNVVRPVGAEADGVKPQDALLAGLLKVKAELLLGLKDPDSATRGAVLQTIESTSDYQFVSKLGNNANQLTAALAGALGDSNRFVRLGAARILGKIAQQRSGDKAPRLGPAEVTALGRLLEYPDLDVQMTTAVALSQCGPAGQDAVAALAQVIASGADSEFRVKALEALGSIGKVDAKTQAAMADLLIKPEPKGSTPAAYAPSTPIFPETRIRRAAAEALTQISRQGALDPYSKNALRQALRDPEAEVRRAASEALLALP